MKDPIEETKKTYDETVEEFKSKTISLMPVDKLSIFVSMLPPSGKVLDVGCGFGRDCKFLVDKGFATNGIDYSEKMIEEAKKYEPRAFYQVMDFRRLDFPKSYFDGIWCNCSLHHIDKSDVPAVLQEFNRILKNQGVLCITVKQGEGQKLILDKRYNKLPKFYAFYGMEELRSLLTKSGFKPIKFFVQDETSYGKIETKNKAVIFGKKVTT